jgi:hypothetical protein
VGDWGVDYVIYLLCTPPPSNHNITNTVPVVYMAQGVMIMMRVTSITRAIGRGGPENGKRDFQGPILPMTLVMDVARIKITKSLRPAPYKLQVH